MCGRLTICCKSKRLIKHNGSGYSNNSQHLKEASYKYYCVVFVGQHKLDPYPCHLFSGKKSDIIPFHFFEGGDLFFRPSFTVVGQGTQKYRLRLCHAKVDRSTGFKEVQLECKEIVVVLRVPDGVIFYMLFSHIIHRCNFLNGG